MNHIEANGKRLPIPHRFRLAAGNRVDTDSECFQFAIHECAHAPSERGIHDFDHGHRRESRTRPRRHRVEFRRFKSLQKTLFLHFQRMVVLAG